MNVSTVGEGAHLFANSKINRSLSVPFIQAIIDEMVSQGLAEWVDSSKQRAYIFWRSLDEWSALLYSKVQEYGLIDGICTLYELTSGDNLKEADFTGADQHVVLRVISRLEAQGKAALFRGTGSEDGVKFLS
mmetsp:Transcript_33650/g.54536  ORF Transcript_33650/g.54536 Transcript_33650/m.54536 type:complete len:132 (-) Transcript_33650:805-1200(-)